MIGITVSALGDLEKCERCFWLYTRGVHKPQIFPSVLNAMDTLEKRDAIIRTRRGEEIRWLYGDATIIEVDKRLETVYNGMKLKGTLDALAKRRDGYVVIDFKTSASPYDLGKANHYYQTQMSAYAYLCTRNGYTPVVGAELVFYCPSLLSDKTATFEIFRVPTIIDMDKVEKLLERANMIAQMDTPPPGSCEWCRYREAASRYE